MAIRTSSTRDVEALVQLLRSPVSIEREAAIARLRVLGDRARARVLALVADATEGTATRVAALKVVDATRDARVKTVASTAIRDPDPAVAAAALQVLRPWLADDDSTTTLERVSALATDTSRPASVRRAAIEALSDVPNGVAEPLVRSVSEQLASIPPLDEPDSVAEWLTLHEDASLGVLHDLLSHAGERGRNAPEPQLRHTWTAVRASVHALLARRDSRIALYDARDMFEHAEGPLPLDMLVTMRAIGDASCLEALAASWERLPPEDWWRGQVQDAARTIVTRERLTGRNAVVRRVRARWPAFLA